MLDPDESSSETSGRRSNRRESNNNNNNNKRDKRHHTAIEHDSDLLDQIENEFAQFSPSVEKLVDDLRRVSPMGEWTVVFYPHEQEQIQTAFREDSRRLYVQLMQALEEIYEQREATIQQIVNNTETKQLLETTQKRLIHQASRIKALLET